MTIPNFLQPSATAYPGADYLPDINETVTPFVPPVSGGFLYSKAGIMTWRGPNGEQSIAGAFLPVVNVKAPPDGG